MTLAGHRLTLERLGTYLAVVRIAARQAFIARAEVIGRAIFYVILLFIFSRLWKVALAEVELAAWGAADVLWYMAATEWIILSLPTVHLDIEQDVRSGDLAYQLARPVSYIGLKLAEAFGKLFVRMFVLGFVGVASAYAFTGRFPDDPRGLLLMVPACVLAGVLGTLFHAAIGVLAFWLQEVSPVYWVWQKLCFVLGGLLLPLELYPVWIQKLAVWTPFAGGLYFPARLGVGGWDPAGALQVLGIVLGWIAVAVLLLIFVTWRGRRVLDVNGG